MINPHIFTYLNKKPLTNFENATAGLLNKIKEKLFEKMELTCPAKKDMKVIFENETAKFKEEFLSFLERQHKPKPDADNVVEAKQDTVKRDKLVSFADTFVQR